MEYEAVAAAAAAMGELHHHQHPGAAGDAPPATLLAQTAHMGYGGHVAGYSSHPGSSHAPLLPPSHRQLMPGAHRIASPTEISQQQQQGSGDVGQQQDGDGPAAKVRAYLNVWS
jgi:hypothetical protein